MKTKAAKRETTAPQSSPTTSAAPAPSKSGDVPARVLLRKGRARPLWYGHPWVYANAVERVEGAPEPGDVVSLADHDGRFIGRGFYNPRSQIPVRLCTRADEAVDAAFFASRVARAKRLRSRLGLPSPSTDVYRLINSEGDDLPGLVVDVYGDAAVAQLTTLGIAARRNEIYDALEAELGVKTIFELAPAAYADLEGFAAGSRVARGASRATLPVVENDIKLEIEPLSGQKTGMFIDQRETRARVGALARGARVLDCYAYAGGFSLAAARGGAAAITAIDSSARAIARIEAHAAANGAVIEAIEADAFRYLETATPQAFDLVIIDPPKFARARKDLEAARKGYERLNQLAMQATAPGGVLVTCSCSQNVDAETFERIVAAGAKQAGREVRVFERRGAAPCHLVPPAFPEGEYLKVLLCVVQ
jgi:23S rRNA (cytosine1962-C5)-methyltransferase